MTHFWIVLKRREKLNKGDLGLLSFSFALLIHLKDSIITEGALRWLIYLFICHQLRAMSSDKRKTEILVWGSNSELCWIRVLTLEESWNQSVPSTRRWRRKDREVWVKVALSLPRPPADKGQWVQSSPSRVEARAGSGISTPTHGSVSCHIPVFFFFLVFLQGILLSCPWFKFRSPIPLHPR